MSTLKPALSETPLAEEHRRVAAALERIAPREVAFDASLYPAETVAKVREQWRTRMVFEHRSSTVFSQLAGQLQEANATLDAQLVMLRMSQDELRHTGTCAEVVRALGGEPEGEADLTVAPLARHEGESAEQRALRNVIYTTCLSEMVACARFVATLDRMSDPYLREVNRRLLADEVLHGQFGFHYLDASREWLDPRPEERAALTRFLVVAFAEIERELAPQGSFEPLTEAEIALGADDPAQAREVFYGTMTGAVIPGLERFGVDASSAWKDRARG